MKTAEITHVQRASWEAGVGLWGTKVNQVYCFRLRQAESISNSSSTTVNAIIDYRLSTIGRLSSLCGLSLHLFAVRPSMSCHALLDAMIDWCLLDFRPFCNCCQRQLRPQQQQQHEQRMQLPHWTSCSSQSGQGLNAATETQKLNQRNATAASHKNYA